MLNDIFARIHDNSLTLDLLTKDIDGIKRENSVLKTELKSNYEQT